MQTLPSRRGLTGQLPLPLVGSGGVKRRVKAVDLAAISIPARDFTGDFYLTHRTGDTLWVTIGDVAGKGLNAAVIMAILQEELERRLTSCATSACDPAVTMRRMHELLLPLHAGNRFATIVIAQIHDDGAVQIANAGHPPPLIARAGGRIERIGSTGPAAGILEHSRWTSVYRHLGRGETLLLYTDGAIEANDFGVDGVAAAFRSAASLPTSRSVAEALADAVKAHGGIEDDLTLLVVRHSER